MNRMDEFNRILAESGQMPAALEMDIIRKNTKKRVFRHRIVTATRNVAIAVLVLMGTLTIGVNTSDVFASSVKNIPLIGRLAHAVDFNKGVEDAVNADYGIEIGQKVKGEYAELEVAYAMADDRSVILFIKATDDGGKYQGNIAVEKMLDVDTGEEILAGYTLPELKTDGEYATLIYDWDCYHKNIAVDLKFDIREGEHSLASDVYSYQFSVGDKLEPKTYDINQDINVGGAKYRIGQVHVYPMSTDVEVEKLNEDEYFTSYMKIELVDENGQIRGYTANGTTGRESNGKWCEVLEGGYFAYEGKLKLRITNVELLPADRREVTLNLDTLEFTDAQGKLSEISDVSRNDDTIQFKLDKLESKFGNTFDFYLNEKGEIEFCPTGYNGEYCILFLDGNAENRIYVNEKNEITLLRYFPDTIIDTDIEIEL